MMELNGAGFLCPLPLLQVLHPAHQHPKPLLPAQRVRVLQPRHHHQHQ